MDHKQNEWISHSSKVGDSKIKVLACWQVQSLVRDHFLLHRQGFLAVLSHSERGKGALWALFLFLIKGTDAIFEGFTLMT